MKGPGERGQLHDCIFFTIIGATISIWVREGHLGLTLALTLTLCIGWRQ